MPVCTCGQKVERLKDSVQCKICKQLLHALCCNIRSCDIELLKNSYKCSNCLSERRNYSLSNEVVVGANVVDTNCSEKLSLSASSSKSPKPESQLIDHIKDNGQSTNCSEMLSLSASSSKSSKPESQLIDHIKDNGQSTSESSFESSGENPGKLSNCSNDIIMREILALKEINTAILSEVKLLRADNKMLKEKIGNFENLLKATTSDKKSKTNNTDISPKRKKLKAINSITVTSMPSASNNLLLPSPSNNTMVSTEISTVSSRPIESKSNEMMSSFADVIKNAQFQTATLETGNITQSAKNSEWTTAVKKKKKQ